MARPKLLTARIPTVTLCLVCATLLVGAWAELAELFVYDRTEILNGELWRIITAPLVHFSKSHLFWNVLVLIAAGWTIEKSDPRGFWIVCVFSCVSPGLMFLWAYPELLRYGGLSGLATGAVVYLCLYKTTWESGNKSLWVAILVLVGVKILVEVATDRSVFMREGTLFQILAATHVLGGVGAIVAFMLSRPAKILCRCLEEVRTAAGRYR